MNPLPENFTPYEKLLVGLVRDQIDFAVVGGVAVAMNGYVRATEDVDIVVHGTPGNLQKLLRSLTQWGQGWARELKVEDFTGEPGAIRLVEDFALDIFVRMREKNLDDFRPRLRHLEIAAVRIPYLAPQDIIYLKEGSWREKDKFDVQAMREIIARESQRG